MICRYALITAVVVCIVLSFALYLSTKTQPQIESPRIAKLEAEKQSAKQKAEASEARAKVLTDDLQRVEKQSKVIREKLRKGDKDRAENTASPAQPTVLPLWAQEKLKLQDELITALENELSVETAKVEAWKESSDNWKKAFQQSERQIECLKIAHEAHLKAVHASRWKGRLEGFAIGVSVGYLGGKLP